MPPNTRLTVGATTARHALSAAHTVSIHINLFQLLDMKLTPHVHASSYGGAEDGTPAILQQYQASQPLSPSFNPTHTSPPYSPKKPFDPHRSNRSSQELYNPTYEEISTGESPVADGEDAGG